MTILGIFGNRSQSPWVALYPFVSVELHRNLSCIAALDTNAPLPRQGQALLKAKCAIVKSWQLMSFSQSWRFLWPKSTFPYCGDSTKFLREVVLDLPQNCNFFPLLLQPTTFFFRFCTLPNMKNKSSSTLPNKKPAALCTFSFPVGGPVQRAHWVAAVKVWGSSFIQVGISPGSRWEDSISPGFWLLVTLSPGKMVTWSLSWLILAAVSPGYLVYHGNLVSGLRSCHSPPSPSHLWSLCSLEKPSPLLTTLSRAPFRGPQSEYRQQYVPCTATRFCTIIEQRMHEKQLHAVQRK